MDLNLHQLLPYVDLMTLTPWKHAISIPVFATQSGESNIRKGINK